VTRRGDSRPGVSSPVGRDQLPSNARSTAHSPASRIALSLGPIDRGRTLSDRVADRILEQIIALGLQPADRLPSVRELELELQASRTVVREAVRSLAGRGVIRIQPGSGLFVAEASGSAARASVNFILRGSFVVRYDKVKEIRRILEVPIAGFAAARAMPDDLAALHDALGRQAAASEDDDVASADVDFHLRLAFATHNELYPVLLDAMGDIMMETRLLTLKTAGYFEQGLEDHRAILAAVQARDAAHARRLMREHLANSELFMQGVDTPLRHAAPGR
jgi:GntR family transcriptional repressor for pyruvate dehydrogenase complex